MRLFLAAILVIATFVGAVLLISRVIPDAGWVGVCVVITCLYASAFAAWALLGNEKKGVSEHQTQDPRRLRDNALYFAVGMAVVTVTLVLAIHDSDRGIQRTWRNDWFVAVGGAIFATGYAAKAHWRLRSDWRLWSLLTALFAIFTAAAVSALSQVEKVPLILAGPLANVEFLIAAGAIEWLIGSRSSKPHLTR